TIISLKKLKKEIKNDSQLKEDFSQIKLLCDELTKLECKIEIDLFHERQMIRSKLNKEVDELKSFRFQIESELKSKSKNPLEKKGKNDKRLDLLNKLIEEKDFDKKDIFKDEIVNTFNERKG